MSFCIAGATPRLELEAVSFCIAEQKPHLYAVQVGQRPVRLGSVLDRREVAAGSEPGDAVGRLRGVDSRHARLDPLQILSGGSGALRDAESLLGAWRSSWSSVGAVGPRQGASERHSQPPPSASLKKPPDGDVSTVTRETKGHRAGHLSQPSQEKHPGAWTGGGGLLLRVTHHP